ncbi:Hypothetical predicted protein, partial [Prunus dulcis]
MYPYKSGRAYPCKIGRMLPFDKVAGHFSKNWAEHSLNTLVSYSSYKKLGRGEFSPCAPWRPPHNTWASKVGPRELKSGGRYFCRGNSVG